jgi:ankyrin repeat protein
MQDYFAANGMTVTPETLVQLQAMIPLLTTMNAAQLSDSLAKVLALSTVLANFNAAAKAPLAILELLVSKGADVKAVSNGGRTPLHYASLFGNPVTAEFLVSEGASINAEDIKGASPLHLAAVNGHLDAIKFLVSKGSNIHSTAKDGATVLHYAAMKGNQSVVEYLVSNGAMVNAVDAEGATPIHIASEFDHKAFIDTN